MKGTLSICLSLVLGPAVLVGLLASGQDVQQRSDDDGMEFEAVVEAVTSADGLRTVVTVAPTSSFEPVRGFVVQNGTPNPVSYSGSAHVRFKPGVLTIALRDGRASRFVVERPGIFEPRAPEGALRTPATGIAIHQADPRAVGINTWRLSCSAPAAPRRAWRRSRLAPTARPIARLTRRRPAREEARAR